MIGWVIALIVASLYALVFGLLASMKMARNYCSPGPANRHNFSLGDGQRCLWCGMDLDGVTEYD